MGDLVVITSMDMERIKPIKVVDIAKDTANELSVCGLVYACDPLGRFLIIEGDPKQLGKSVNAKEYAGKSHLLAVNLKGKIIKDFGLTDGASMEYATLSRNGKYFIYNKPGQLGEGQIRVVSVDDKNDRIIKSKAIPVSVSDDGDAIVAEGGLMRAMISIAEGNASRDIGYIVSKWDRAVNMSRILGDKSIIHVLANDNRLYYVTASEKGSAKVSFLPLDALFGKKNTQ